MKKYNIISSLNVGSDQKMKYLDFNQLHNFEIDTIHAFFASRAIQIL